MSHDHEILYDTEGISQSKRIIYTPSEFTRKNLLYVQEVGRSASLQQHSSSREKLDTFLLLKVIEGEGMIISEGITYQLKQDSIILLDCQNYYEQISNEISPWKIEWIHYNGKTAQIMYETILKVMGGKRVFSIPLKLDRVIDELFCKLTTSSLENELREAEMLQKLLDDILILLLQANSMESKLDWNQIRNYINEHCTEKDCLEQILNKYRMPEEELKKGFQNKFGITYDNYIEQRKVTLIKEMLRFTTQSLEQIVEQVGITDEKIFMEKFVEHEHMTPDEYRKNWSQWIRVHQEER